jgi:hypothetical protein
MIQLRRVLRLRAKSEQFLSFILLHSQSEIIHHQNQWVHCSLEVTVIC